jgi:DNA-binding response OmpR family regulator
VDDDPRVVDLLRGYLTMGGFAVEVATDADEGFRKVLDIQPAAITVDLVLPGADGWSLLERVRANQATADIPIIIVSVLDEQEKALALGVGYVAKPINRSALLAALDQHVHRPGPRAERPKVLAIDDDPMAMELIAAILEPQGYTVLRVNGGEEGLTLARQERPALVILDLTMPLLDGFTVAERLRSDPSTSAIPVLVFTARPIDEDESERLAGCISHLARKEEFRTTEFVELVRRLCPPVAA